MNGLLTPFLLLACAKAPPPPPAAPPPEDDISAVKDVVVRNFGQLTYCYEDSLKADPTVAGRVDMEWYVEAGRVTWARIEADSSGDPTLAECIRAKIERWKFPEAIQGQIIYPFIFKAKAD